MNKGLKGLEQHESDHFNSIHGYTLFQKMKTQ